MSPALTTTIQQLQLKDIWEKLHPLAPGHTYISHNSSSRLDRIYVNTGLCEHLCSADTHVCSFSDHKALAVRICLPNLGRAHGHSYWSLRPHVLTPEHVEEFQNQWQYWTRQRRNYASWMMWWLSYAKPKIKSFFRWKAKTVFDDFHRQQQLLYTELRDPQSCYDSHDKSSKGTNASTPKKFYTHIHENQRDIRCRRTHIRISTRRTKAKEDYDITTKERRWESYRAIRRY